MSTVGFRDEQENKEKEAQKAMEENIIKSRLEARRNLDRAMPVTLKRAVNEATKVRGRDGVIEFIVIV